MACSKAFNLRKCLSKVGKKYPILKEWHPFNLYIYYQAIEILFSAFCAISKFSKYTAVYYNTRANTLKRFFEEKKRTIS